MLPLHPGLIHHSVSGRFCQRFHLFSSLGLSLPLVLSAERERVENVNRRGSGTDLIISPYKDHSAGGVILVRHCSSLSGASVKTFVSLTLNPLCSDSDCPGTETPELEFGF